MSNQHKVFVIGGGASGMIAAISAKMAGADVTILERNSRIGKKILATGNGRCNYTNIYADVNHYHGTNPDFIYGAFSAFDVSKTIGFFEKLGIAPKIEEQGKVFPMSEQASSVLDVLLFELNDLGVNIICNAYVKKIKKEKGKFKIFLEDGSIYKAERVILACGGKAMPSSGSDGNGYDLAKQLEHSIVKIFPALVQLKLDGNFFKQIDGVKFKGTAEVVSNNKVIATDSGDILFANYGVSGPPILQLSRIAGELLNKNLDAQLKIVIIDTMSREELKQFLIRRFKFMPNRALDFSLVGFINKRLIRVILKQAGFKDLKVPVKSLTLSDIEKIVDILQDWRFKITGTKSWPSAQVTAGGVDTKEIDQYTMESKIVKDLFFAGEMIDIDGNCGGFNLQWAWSSGYVAGQNAAK